MQDASTDASFGYSGFLIETHDRRKSPLKWPENRHDLVSMISKSKLTFCFVRNPFTRVLSAYLDKFSANAERRNLFLKELRGESEDSTSEFSFLQFLELVAQQRLSVMNAHWRPQSFHLIDSDIGYDLIGRFEALSRDFGEVLKRIGPKTGDFLITTDEHRTKANEMFSSYYADPLSAQLVRTIYAEDFERFGYSDDPARAMEILPPTMP